jgi:hypothetical protein
MSEEQDSLAEARSSWDRHPFTLHTVRQLERRVESLLHELKGACDESNDPRVAGAYARYMETCEHLAMYRLRTGGSK